MLGIIGFGSWGTALSIACSYNKKHVLIWSRDKEQKLIFKKYFYNKKYMPKIKLPKTISITLKIKTLCEKSDILLFAIPSFIFKHILLKIRKYIKPYHKIVIGCKGLEHGIFFHKIIIDNLGNRKIAILTGPSFANEISQKKPASITIGSNDKYLLFDLLSYFHSKLFQVYSSVDIIGLQLCSIYKNILSFGCGISDALNFGENARSILIIYGIYELKKLSILLGAKKKTILGLSGIGDIILTCTSNKSRNYIFGYNIGIGENFKLLKKTSKKIIESIHNIYNLLYLSQKYDIKLNIILQIKNIIKNITSPLTSIKKILKII